MNTHLKEAHIYVCVDVSGRVSLAISGVTAATNCCKVILALNNLFHFRCEIKYGVISAILQYIGRAEDAAEYQYIVGFFNDALSE
jgi:hypothetical protein